MTPSRSNDRPSVGATQHQARAAPRQTPRRSGIDRRGPQPRLWTFAVAVSQTFRADQNISAIKWLDNRFGGVVTPMMQAETSTETYRDSELKPSVDEIQSESVRTDAYILVTKSTARTGVVTAFFDGDKVSSHYLRDFLENNNGLIYTSADARVYR